MAILETSIKRFIGTATDEKPYPGMFTADGREITEADLPPGSTYMVKDSNTNVMELFHWTGREWVSGVSPEMQILGEIKALLAELVEQQKSIF